MEHRPDTRAPPDATDQHNWANVEITYSGRLGDLIAVAASYDDSKRYGLQSPFSSSISYMWKAGMWRVDPTHDTLITTGNGGQKDARVAISLFYGDTGVYEMPEQFLLPGQQTWVNLGDLIRHQIADKNGRVIPPGVMEGSYEIKDLDAKGAGYLYEGKTITDKTLGHATYGCAECCMQTGPGYNSFDILDNPAYGGIGDRYQFYAAATDVCSGLYGDVAANNWSSSDTSVGTIDDTGNISFVGAGTTTVTASSRLGSVNNCCCRPQTFNSSATANVDGPYRGTPVKDVYSHATSFCPTGYAGWDREVIAQVFRFSGTAYTTDGVSLGETVQVGNNGLNLSSNVETGSTTTAYDPADNLHGTYIDEFYSCSNLCPGSGSETDALQTITYNGLGLPHSNALVYKCGSVTVDGN